MMGLSAISSFKFLPCFFRGKIARRSRGYATALYIPGRKADSAVSILTPSLEHIDSLLIDRSQMEQSIFGRGIKFDMDDFAELWIRMKEERVNKKELEDRRALLSDSIKTIMNSAGDKGRIEELKKQGKDLRESLRKLTKSCEGAEEAAITQALSLPNILHPETPVHQQRKLDTFSRDLKCSSAELQDLSKDNMELVNHSPTAYYLKKSVAELELKLARLFSNRFITQGFNLISSPDLVKSVVVDGCSLGFSDPTKVFSLAVPHERTGTDHINTGKTLHLVGGASLPAMVAFLTKNVIREKPALRLVSVGRQYNPCRVDSPTLLTNTAQSVAVQLLTVLDNTSAEALYDECTAIRDVLSELFRQFGGIDFDVVSVAAHQLEPWEQYRCAVQVFCPDSNAHVQVARVSIVGDYISRRLSIYGPDGRHPGLVTATALSVTKLLACAAAAARPRK